MPKTAILPVAQRPRSIKRQPGYNKVKSAAGGRSRKKRAPRRARRSSCAAPARMPADTNSGPKAMPVRCANAAATSGRISSRPQAICKSALGALALDRLLPQPGHRHRAEHQVVVLQIRRRQTGAEHQHGVLDGGGRVAEPDPRRRRCRQRRLRPLGSHRRLRPTRPTAAPPRTPTQSGARRRCRLPG